MVSSVTGPSRKIHFYIECEQYRLATVFPWHSASDEASSRYQELPRGRPPLVAKEANARGKNATFPSLHPVPADPYKSLQGSLLTTRGRRRGCSNTLGFRVRPRRYGSYGCIHGLQVSARDAPFFACASYRWPVQELDRRCLDARWCRGHREK